MTDTLEARALSRDEANEAIGEWLDDIVMATVMATGSLEAAEQRLNAKGLIPTVRWLEGLPE